MFTAEPAENTEGQYRCEVLGFRFQVSGLLTTHNSPEKIKGLEKAYGLSHDGIDYEGLFFAVHTYYALVMKLLAAEVAVSSGGSYLQSYLKKFEEAYYLGHEELKNILRDVEEGDIFSVIAQYLVGKKHKY